MSDTMYARLLRDDTPRDLLRILLVAVAYAVTDVLTRATASVPAGTDPSTVLAWRSIIANPLGVVLLLGATGLVWRAARGALFAGWDSIDQGRTLRWFAVPLVGLTVWELAFYEYNYMLDQWHGVDRILLIVLAVAAWFRPIALVPLVLQARILAGQFSEPFGTTAGENIGELLLIALLILAAIHIIVALTNQRESASAVLVLGAALATHFFLPGVAKARLGWIGANEPGNFALNSHVAGWMGGGDGSWARSLADTADSYSWVIIGVTVVAELCAFVGVYHRNLLRSWLVLWVGFHLGIFFMSGFFLIGWIILELALFMLLVSPRAAPWLSKNDTPARGLLAVALVLFAGPFIFHPPRLAWLDAPISHGYEVEAVGESGMVYQVPLTAFAPFQQELSFGFAEFRNAPNAVGGYGAAGSKWLVDALEAIDSFDELDALEAGLKPNSVERREKSEALVTQWFETVNERGDPQWFLLAPPTRLWASAESPTFDFQEPLESVTIVQVVAIHETDESVIRRTPVLVVEANDSGNAEVVARSDD